jgi:hypothetical protein
MKQADIGDVKDLVNRLTIGALVIVALVGLLGSPASAAGSAKCTLISVRRSHPPGDPWKRGPWVAKVRVKNTFSMVEHIRGVWHVDPPYERRFELRARLQPGEREYAKYVLEKGGATPNVELRGCHVRAPTLGH